MPWRERSIMSQREEFCRLARAPELTMRGLCRHFGISPSTGYHWLQRFAAEGPAGLVDRSRRPHASPERTPAWLEAEVLAVRRDHPAWGGRKIRAVLLRRGLAVVPAASTITAILRRHGRLDGPGAGAPRAWQRFAHLRPNELWQMDFKGYIGLPQGRCHPLTILDDHSRYALELSACADQRTETVRARLERVFRQHGLPDRLLTDNGSPWGTAGSAARHTLLTVWLLDLEVTVIHGRPFHPQTQGKEERFHRTLELELLDGRSFADHGQAQIAFDAWREIYNGQRPHEALDMATPASRYAPSARVMPDQIRPPDYEPGIPVRTVHAGGWISFQGHRIKCSKAFVGRRIAVRATNTDGIFDLCYRRHRMTRLDLRHAVVIPQPVQDVSEHVSSLSPV
jgi:transposase InsO family protein